MSMNKIFNYIKEDDPSGVGQTISDYIEKCREELKSVEIDSVVSLDFYDTVDQIKLIHETIKFNNVLSKKMRQSTKQTHKYYKSEDNSLVDFNPNDECMEEFSFTIKFPNTHGKTKVFNTNIGFIVPMKLMYQFLTYDQTVQVRPVAIDNRDTGELCFMYNTMDHTEEFVPVKMVAYLYIVKAKHNTEKIKSTKGFLYNYIISSEVITSHQNFAVRTPRKRSKIMLPLTTHINSEYNPDYSVYFPHFRMLMRFEKIENITKDVCLSMGNVIPVGINGSLYHVNANYRDFKNNISNVMKILNNFQYMSDEEKDAYNKYGKLYKSHLQNKNNPTYVAPIVADSTLPKNMLNKFIQAVKTYIETNTQSVKRSAEDTVENEPKRIKVDEGTTVVE